MIKSKFVKAILGIVLGFGVLASASSANAYTFTAFLKPGVRNADVKEMQKLLNSMADTMVALTGAGSPGNETTYYGSKTVGALKKFQAKFGLVADGLVGPKTRAKLNVVSMGSVSGNFPAGCTSAAGYSPLTGLPCSSVNSNAPTTSGAISASLASSNPAAGTVVDNQATADLLHITFSGNGTVNSVMLKRLGLSDQNTIANVYLYDGAMRLTDGYSFNSNGEITINNLGLVVNGSKTIAVKADLASNASNNSTVGVALTGFTAAGSSMATANVSGNIMSIAAVSGLATVSYNGGNTVTAATVNSGISSYSVWRQGIQVNQRTVWLKGANFRVTGSAPASSLSNIKLYVDGVDTGKVGMISMMNGSNYISFDLMTSPVALTTGGHTVEVRSDISGGASYNFTVSLQQASDLMILDPQYNVNIAISSFTSSTAGQITINPGSATVVVDPTFNTMTNVTGGASNVAIAKFKVHGYGEDVKVNTLTVTPSFTTAPTLATGTCTNNTDCSLDDVTLYFNGTQVGSQADWSGTGNLTFNLGSQMIIPANVDSTIEVRANIRNTSGVNYTAGVLRANLATGSSNAEGRVSHTTVNFPAATVTGTQLTLQTGLLGVAKNTGYANQTQNPNTAGVKIGSFVLQNQSSSESVRVTSLKVDLSGTSALTNLSGLRTSIDPNYQVQPQASNTFSVPNLVLAPGATQTVDIFADTSASTGVTVITTLTVTSIGVTSNVSATSSATAGQTITLSAGTLGTPTLLTASSTTAQYIAAADPMMTGTGATDGSKATFNFVSTGGASTINELKFTISGTATDPVMNVKVCIDGTATCSASAPVVGGVAWLQNLNLAVPNGGSGLTLNAFVTYSPVGTSGVTPNTTAITTLTYVKYVSGGTTTVTTPSVAAPTVTLVGSKPTLSVNSTTQTGLNIAGESKIGEVTITADAKGNIKVNDIVFTVSSSGFSTAPTAIGSPRIADGTTTISGSACTPASLVVTCEFGTTSNTDYDGYTISAGTSKVVSLFGTLTGAAATGSGTPTVSSSIGSSTFNWDDTSTNGASGTNLSGALIYNFPTNSYSVRQ